METIELEFTHVPCSLPAAPDLSVAEVFGSNLYRAAVPGGWLLRPGARGNNPAPLTFVPDPTHQWGAPAADQEGGAPCE